MTTTSLSRFYAQTLPNICVDTRAICHGDLFFALKGARVDGHAFVGQAFQKGAVAAVVDKNFEASDEKQCLIVVPDTLQALQQLAKEKMANFFGPVIAITGSVGKTTTKDFLVTLLSAKYRVACTPNSCNSQIGMPLSLLNCIQANDQVVVVEMGMSLPGQIAQLVSIAPPDISVLTAIGLSHAANFDSLEAIAAAKAEIFAHAKTTTAIIHHACTHFRALLDVQTDCKIAFGPINSSAAYTFAVQSESLHILQDGYKVASLPKPCFLGQHNLSNLLAAMLAAKTQGMAWSDMQAPLALCTLPKSRLQIKVKQQITFLDDSYNASVLSIKAALDTLFTMHFTGKRLAVLGEMAELGAFSADCHREVAMYALQKVDVAIFIGSAFQGTSDRSARCFFACSSAEAVHMLRHLVSAGDGVLLKGANSAKLGLIIDEF